MAQVFLTADDVTEDMIAQYSDMHKECYNVRPFCSPSKTDVAWLWNHYSAIQERIREEEDAEEEFNMLYPDLR